MADRFIVVELEEPPHYCYEIRDTKGEIYDINKQCDILNVACPINAARVIDKDVYGLYPGLGCFPGEQWPVFRQLSGELMDGVHVFADDDAVHVSQRWGAGRYEKTWRLETTLPTQELGLLFLNMLPVAVTDLERLGFKYQGETDWEA